jgi:hypothetical protein
MNNPDHISDELRNNFGLNTVLKFFDADGSGMGKIRSRIRDGKIRIRDTG